MTANFDRLIDGASQAGEKTNIKKLHTTFKELFFHYQPQYNIHTNNFIGIEALVRWNKPDKGIINPGDFIPVAENTELIIPMGEWIIESTFKQIKLWEENNLTDFSVSINLSRRQLTSTSLVDTIKNLFSIYKI